jgi:hypothetical protein
MKFMINLPIPFASDISVTKKEEGKSPNALAISSTLSITIRPVPASVM